MAVVFPTNGANGFVASGWEEELLQAYRTASILPVVAHEILPVGVGGKYYINRFNSGAALVEDYDGTQPLNYNEVGTTRIEITPDNAKAWGVKLDDANEASLVASLRQPVLEQAGHELSLAVDRFMMETILASNVDKKVITTADYANFDPYAEIVDANTRMSLNAVPSTGRVVIVSPEVLGMLMKDQRFIQSYNLSQGILQNGLIDGCHINGCQVVVATPDRFPISTGFMVLHKQQAFGYMQLLAKTEVLRSQDYFQDLVRGLIIFGGAVIRDEAICIVGRDDQVTI